MTLKDRIKALAKKRGISLPVLEAELGFGNSTIVKWDKSVPNAEKLNSVAKYFDVSMDYLLNGTDKDGLNEKDNKDIAKDLENIMSKLSAGEDGPASFEGTDIPEEDLELFAGQVELMLRRLKAINKEKYNPHKNKK
ncbi:MAG: helix-turn-helix transcriptional regulator [Lachnospiraceae bacterium]|jgi:transcriptional regulator with XRE-family HTH domain|nr:helix-turn-helix transcriptional regulator [Lachnospiraceae bacterium]